LGLKHKVKPTSFDQENGRGPFNASGVAEVGADRFVFIDNNDPSAVFELALDADGVGVERISRRPLAGLTDGALRDPEGLTRVGGNGDVVLVVASSLCVSDANRPRHVCDGLVRVRYRPHGDLHAEAMPGFRDWLLRHVPSLDAAGVREPDAGGLNVEGVAWEPNARTLLFGLRGPTDRGIVTVIRVPVDVGSARWTIEALGSPSMLRVRIPRSKAMQGIRDLTYDEQTGDLLILIGRSTSMADEPFQLCRWDGSSGSAHLLDITFRRSMKPEGIVAFSSGDERRLLIVDDRGGYAVVGYPQRDQ
jgi:hypothetical protein